MISLVRRSALRKGRGVTELYESTPVLSLSLRIPSPSIILLLRPSTTQTPSLPSRRSSLLLPPSLFLSLSLGLLFHSSFPLPPFLAVSSFLPFFFHPLRLLVLVRLFLLPAKRASILTPCWSQCRSNPLLEHISPWPPYQSLLTWSLNQYLLPLPRLQRVFLSFFPTVSFASSPRHVYIWVSVRMQRYLPLLPIPYAVYPVRALCFLPLLSFAILLLSRLLLLPHESIREFRVHSSRDAVLFIAIHCFRSLRFFPCFISCLKPRNLPLRIEGMDK